MFEKRINNYNKAIHYYLAGVKQKNTDAMNHLGLLYQNVFRDYEKAEKYYSMAIKNGSTEGLNNLAWLYFIRKEDKWRKCQSVRYNLAKNPFRRTIHVKQATPVRLRTTSTSQIKFR